MPTETSQKAPEKKAADGGKANALLQPLRPSAELAAVVGPGPLPRGVGAGHRRVAAGAGNAGSRRGGAVDRTSAWT